MQVDQLEFKNYRNLQDNQINFGNAVNIIYGNNAQGKTNLLEAIWLFSGNRSFRGVKDKEYIKFDNIHTQLEMKFTSQNRKQNMDIVFHMNGSKCLKQIELNEIFQKSASKVVGKLNCVIFSPTHLSLVKGAPSERRKFLNAALYQIKPSYGKNLSDYNETLMQRNALLKEISRKNFLIDTLDVWDQKISQLSGQIIYDRLKYIQVLNQIIQPIYFGMSSEKENLKILYSRSSMQNLSAEQISNIILDELTKSREKDLYNTNTSVGPHRDDLEFFINDIPSKSFASQGQQRSIVLSLKLAESEILQNKFSEAPIMLLDDVMSELDESRQNYILNSIEGRQIFITCCELSTVTRLTSGKVFHINNGMIKEK